MPRQMSFRLTAEDIRNRSKTVTRRLGWENLKAGELLWAVNRVQGLKRGEHPVRLALLRVESVRREKLSAMDGEDVWKEGNRFTLHAVHEFQREFLQGNGLKEDVDPWLTRVEFSYLAPWITCPGEDGEFVCQIHGGHAAQCLCPEVDAEAWGEVDPYGD